MNNSETNTSSNNQSGKNNYQLLNEKQLEKLGLLERIAYMHKLIEQAGKKPNIFTQLFNSLKKGKL